MTNDLQRARFLQTFALIRYWDDARLNGTTDTEGNIPLRHGDEWRPTIELATGRVMEWPAGVEAETCYKVSDGGDFWLLDANQQRIAKWKRHYVPLQFLDIEDTDRVNIAGDYIVLKIGGDGLIDGWRNPAIELEQWVPI